MNVFHDPFTELEEEVVLVEEGVLHTTHEDEITPFRNSPCYSKQGGSRLHWLQSTHDEPAKR